MDSNEHPTRRAFVRLGGLAALTTLAGCVGAPFTSASNGTGGRNPSPGAGPNVGGPYHTADGYGPYHGGMHDGTHHDGPYGGGMHHDGPYGGGMHHDGPYGGGMHGGGPYDGPGASGDGPGASGNGPHATADDGYPSAPASSVTVEMTSTARGPVFHPAIAWIEPGGSVTFRNVDGAHSATAYAPANGRPRRIPNGARAFDTGLLSGDAERTVRFETPGVYDYLCRPHEGLGMVGTVVVGRPRLAGQPGLAVPQSSLPARARTHLSAMHDRVRSMMR